MDAQLEGQAELMCRQLSKENDEDVVKARKSSKGSSKIRLIKCLNEFKALYTTFLSDQHLQAFCRSGTFTCGHWPTCF